MEKLLYANNASTTVDGTLAQGGTTLMVATGTGSRFPSPGAGEAFLVTLYETNSYGDEEYVEVVKCTARTGDTLTVERDVESMTGNAGGYAYPSAAGRTVSATLRWTALSASEALTAARVKAATEKTTPVDADAFHLTDTAASDAPKKITWASLKAAVKNYLVGVANNWTEQQTFSKTAVFAEYDNGDSGSAATITLANGNFQKITLTANTTLTVSTTGAGPGRYSIRLIQDATGGRVVTLSGLSASRWLGSATAHSLNTAANGETVLTLLFDGTNLTQSADTVGA